MGDLTANFSERELACRGEGCCGNRLFPKGGFKATYRHWQALEKLRQIAGRKITVTSGYRCPIHNKEEGGVPNSTHIDAIGSDIIIEGLSPNQMKTCALQVPEFAAGGIGLYHNRIHVDSRLDGPARWDNR